MRNRRWLSQVPYDTPLTGLQAEIAAARAFVRLPIVAKEQIGLPRSERRRMMRSGEPIPDIRIIQLRRRERGDGNQASAREYHHRWIVSGHWRKLHEPRKADDAEVTFVSSYVKGPENAPLLQPRESVYVVAR